MVTIRETLREGYFGVLPKVDLELLLAKTLGQTRTFLHAYPEKKLSEQEAETMASLCAQRSKGVPVAYLLGDMAFLGRRFRVTESTLIPRPETEELVSYVLSLDASCYQKVVDVGVGSGVIAISLALERPLWQVHGIDISAEALAVAKANSAAMAANSIVWHCQDGLGDLQGFDLIVSNPPYIAEGDPHLSGDGLKFEPSLALTSGVDGLVFIRRLVCEASHALNPGGCLVLEHGYDQSDQVQALFAENGFERVRSWCDYAGHARFVEGFIGC